MYSWPSDMGESTRLCAMAIVNLIAAAADRDDRCPTTQELSRRGLSNPPVAHLADIGILRSEVYAKNYRVVFICQGPHQGKRTKSAPYAEPYLVIGPERPELKGAA